MKCFPDEGTLLHCLRQIGAHPSGWATELVEKMALPDFDLRLYFCEHPHDGPYVHDITIRGKRLSFDYGVCDGGLCGQGNRYVFRLPENKLDENETSDTGWIH
ncbi:MAG: hypothetical protein WEB53_12880 [Akkermansiaceae bacterium]